MAKAKEVNYTDEQVSAMVKTYTDAPGPEAVAAIADEIGKSKRSVIAKLSREGVYVAKPRTTKTGGPIIRKEELVKMLEDELDIELSTLIKAGKADLQRLVDVVVQDTEAELADALEVCDEQD